MQQARHISLVGLFATLGAIAVACVFVETMTRADEKKYVQTETNPTIANPTQSSAPGDDSYDWTYWRDFWSFKLVTQPAVPQVKNNAWVRNPVDAFVLAQLEAKNITPAPPADKLTWLRRVTILLTGLPPTPEELEAFLDDEDHAAHDKVIDRLLASPHYGERMGRHWLDVVRYEQNRVRLKHQPKFRGELHYRDYVVRAFNEDKPYDRFILEQIAGDLLEVLGDPDKDAKWRKRYFDQIIAPAFLSIGDWFDECTDPNKLRMDIVDDMVDTTGKVFMGLSLGCARCHDHPFDPVTTEDYYAMAGIFKSTKIIGDFSEFWRDGRERMTRPLVSKKVARENEQGREKLLQIVAEMVQSNEDARDYIQSRFHLKDIQEAAEKVTKPPVVTLEAEDFAGVDNLKISELEHEAMSTPISPENKKATVIETRTPMGQWARYTFRLPKTGVYEIQLLYSAMFPTPIDVKAGRNPTKIALTDPIEGTGGWGLRYRTWQSIGQYVMSAGPNALRLSARIDPETKTARFPQVDKIRLIHVTDAWEAEVKKVAESARVIAGSLRHYLIHNESPHRFAMGKDSPASHWSAKFEGFREKIKTAQAAIKTYPTILSVTDQPLKAIGDIPVHIRGDVYRTRDEPTPRALPRLFDNVLVHIKMPDDESGRLQLALRLIDPKNPLTARVMVNRIWQWHFGEGLVSTPNDFGSRGAKPTHPALLDWLAAEFVKSGWSVKHVQKWICQSNTYRMSSDRKRKAESRKRKDDQKIQPFSGRSQIAAFPKQRLSVEAIYDAMLCSIGKVRRQEVIPLDFNKSADRMMYVLTSNRSPKGMGVEIKKMFGVFDYQPAGVSLPKREQTSTAAQSLWFMNSPLPRHFAEQLAARVLLLKQITEGERLAKVYVLALGRFPSEAMTNATLDYVRAAMNDGASREEAWTRVCLAVYSSSEFRYVE